MRPEEIIPQGGGSGLDADTLDTYHASAFVRKSEVRSAGIILIALITTLLLSGGVLVATDVSGSHRQQTWFPVTNAAIVTPSDSNNLPFVTTSLRIASAGAVRVTLLGGTTVTYPSGALAVGIAHPMRVTRVWASGTTVGSGNIIAEW